MNKSTGYKIGNLLDKGLYKAKIEEKDFVVKVDSFFDIIILI